MIHPILDRLVALVLEFGDDGWVPGVDSGVGLEAPLVDFRFLLEPESDSYEEWRTFWYGTPTGAPELTGAEAG